MSRKLDLFIGVALATGIHALGAFGHQFLPSGTAADTKAAPEEVPTIALKPFPPVEPEPPDPADVPPAPADELPPPEIAPPMQTDVPAPIVATAFVQNLQPPPPPEIGTRTAAITIPRGNFSRAPAANIKNLFNLADLDQKPAPTFAPKPAYPYEMRRARINGEVVVGFMLDAEGTVLNPYIVSSTHTGFEAEALRTIQRWKFRPGRKGGKNVAICSVHLPLIFNLASNE